MNRRVVWPVLALVIVTTMLAIAGPESAFGKDGNADHPSSYDIRTKLPRELAEHYILLAASTMSAVYPDADGRQFRSDLERELLDGDCSVRASVGGGTFLVVEGTNTEIVCAFSMGPSRSMGLGIQDPPEVSEPDEAGEAVDRDEAVGLAEAVVKRVEAGKIDLSRYEMTVKGTEERFKDYEVLWELPKDRPYHPRGDTYLVRIRKSDGSIQWFGHLRPLPEPKMAYEKIVDIAGKSIPNFSSKNLSLVEKNHYADIRAFWEYAEVNRSEGHVMNLTRWDANTGELLYSEVLNGGKRNEPYMNPGFYSYPSKNEVRAMVEKLLEERAKELEKQEEKE